MGQPWSEERKRKFGEAVSKAWKSGKYINRVELLKKERRENSEWRKNQREAASRNMKENNPMNDPTLKEKMRLIKKEQFAGYDLPEWYAKQGGRPIYNKRLASLLSIIFEEKPVEALFGSSEQKFGRFWIDCYFPSKKLAIEWNEPFHDNTQNHDDNKMRLLREHNKDVSFVTLKESDIIEKGNYMSIQSKMNLINILSNLGVWE